MRDLSIETIIVALAFIDAHDRDVWLNMGNALKTEFGEIAFAVFDNWSQTADNYDAKAVKSTWKGYTLGKVNIGTLIRHAKQSGFDPKKHESKLIDPQEQAARQAKREQQEREAIANEQAEHAAYMKLLPQIGQAANYAITTPYGENKGITSVLLAIYSKDLHRFKNPIDPTKTIGYYLDGLITLVPYKRLDTKQLVAFQAINGAPDSEGKNKGRFAKQFIGKVFFGGGYYWIGDIDTQGVKIIVEGMSDANTLFEKAGYCSLAAGNDKRLMQAALDLRQHRPNDFIIIFGDNDKDCKGQRLAQSASQAIKNSIFLLPPPQYKDVNEWYLAEGSEGIKQMIDAAIDSKKAAPSDTEGAAQITHTSEPIIEDGLHGGEGQGDEWQEPDSIINAQESDDYPLAHLPESLRLLVVEIVDYLQCPVAMAANAVLAALSLSIQGLVNVARDNELIGTVSLFLMVIAESGERKSACDSLVTGHIKELDKKRLLADMEILKFWQSDFDTWAAERDGLIQCIKQLAKSGDSVQNQKEELRQLDQDKPEKPRGTTMMYEDTTIEGLTKALFNNCPSAGIFSSEAGVVFGGHGMNSDSAMRNMATLNKLWDGGDVIATRSDITKNMLITGRRLTLSLATQESTVRAFFDGSKGLARGTGFGARFLIAWPKSTQGTRFYKFPPSHWPHKTAFIQRTSELLHTLMTMDEETGALQTVTLELSKKAQAAWIEFYNDTERELRTGGELADIKDVTSKAADNVARIAALFHVYEHGITGTISEAHILSANHLMAWYLMESKRFFNEAILPKELRNVVLLDNWLIQHCKEHEVSEISTRTIKQFCPNVLRDKTIFDDTLKHLIELNRVKIVKDGKKKQIHLNPKLLEV